jgi:FHA domain-containing protein
VIKLTVQTYNGAPLPQALSAQFDELGGSIGRADNNQLVLPDPERSISRVHAQVNYRNGAYVLVDRGSNAVLVNGRPLGNGVESPLSPGDQVQIGGYAIRVDAGSPGGAGLGAGAASDPFGDLGGMAFSSPPAAPPRAPQAGGGGGGLGGAGLDPMAAFGFSSSPAPAGGDPFGFGGAPAAPSPGARPSASPAPAAGGIPDDWDPFAPDPVSAPKPQDLARSLGQTGALGLELGAAAAGPLIPGMGDLGGGKANTASSIDAMFGLGAAGGADPLANSVLAQASIQPNMANHIDPLRSLNSVSVASATAAPDNVSALNQPFMEAPMVPTGGKPASAPASPASPPAASSAAGSAVMSWDDGAQDSRTVIRPKGAGSKLGDFDSWGTTSPPAAPAAPAAAAGSLDPLTLMGGGPSVSDPLDFAGLGTPLSGSGVSPPGLPMDAGGLFGGDAGSKAPVAPVSKPAPAAAHPSAPAVASIAPPRAASASVPSAQPPARPAVASQASSPTGESADQAALINALREGLGTPALPVQSLTPEFMKLLGQLVHESTSGTVDLLVARAALKREIRAEVTMIVAKENNPLKFSPSVEVALNHLLSPPARGFMPPAQAMRDAYDDLRAHQFAFVAGMRAALEGVLKRFDPEVLEGKLTQKSVLSTLLPASRKAKMWDVFNELYSQISAEASDDFHELFGKEFLRAYEEHIDQLQRDA